MRFKLARAHARNSGEALPLPSGCIGVRVFRGPFCVCVCTGVCVHACKFACDRASIDGRGPGSCCCGRRWTEKHSRTLCVACTRTQLEKRACTTKHLLQLQRVSMRIASIDRRTKSQKCENSNDVKMGAPNNLLRSNTAIYVHVNVAQLHVDDQLIVDRLTATAISGAIARATMTY